jgi:anaerobic magnesium-protoporphyrin IX monomethyl ester cyclase
MKIALIQPDSPYLSYPLAFPSLGLLYISAYLKNHGYKVDYYDLTGGKKLPDIKADIIAFTCQITQYPQVLAMKNKLQADRFIIGGPFPTHSPEICAHDGFQVIRGEGEIAMLQAVENKNETLGYVDPNFFPDWEAIDLKRYGYLLEDKKCINIMTKRGNCPYKCAFCAKQEDGKSPLRFRTAKNVLQEVRYLKKKGFGAIAIYDDDVLIDKERDYEIFMGLKELGMPYRCMTRTNLANRKNLEFLKATGCAELAIGVETADNNLRKIIRKGTTVEQDTEFVKICRAIGLRIKTYLMIGLPGESKESVIKTFSWLKQAKPDNFDISVFTPYPGCDIYKHKENYDISWDEKELRKIWFSGEAQYGSCAVSTSGLTAQEILELKSLFNRKEGGTTSYWKPI